MYDMTDMQIVEQKYSEYDAQKRREEQWLLRSSLADAVKWLVASLVFSFAFIFILHTELNSQYSFIMSVLIFFAGFVVIVAGVLANTYLKILDRRDARREEREENMDIAVALLRDRRNAERRVAGIRHIEE